MSDRFYVTQTEKGIDKLPNSDYFLLSTLNCVVNNEDNDVLAGMIALIVYNK